MPRSYWFPARRFGWGWGLPCAGQGWAALALWGAVVAAGLAWLPDDGPVPHAPFVGAMTLILVVVLWATGEPPRWRWGGSGDDAGQDPDNPPRER